MLKLQKNDIGFVFKGTIQNTQEEVVDISAATEKYFIFKQPDGVVVNKVAFFSTNGTDGKIQYIFVGGDLDVIGIWSVQAHIIFSATEWKSHIKTFRVVENI